MLGFAEGSEREDVKTLAEQLGKTYPLVMDYNGQIAAGFGVSGVPETFFVSRDGIVQYHQIGMFDEDTIRIFEGLLSKN